MASEPVLNNTNVLNNSQVWQSNSDSFNYNQSLLQIKSTNNQYFHPPYQQIPAASNFYASQLNYYTTNDQKNSLSCQTYNPENSEFLGLDNERFRFYPNGQYYNPSHGKGSNSMVSSTTKPLFNPIFQNNFFEPKDYQSNYLNPNRVSNENFQSQPAIDQKWSFNPMFDSGSGHFVFENLQKNLQEDSINKLEKFDHSHEGDFSESSQDSANASPKNEPSVNGKDNVSQLKNQSSNQKKTRTKDKYRVVYNELQRSELEKEFNFSKYITSRRKSELANKLELSQRQIKIWFQNRRAKDRKMNKKKKIELNNSNGSVKDSAIRLSFPNGESVNNSFNLHEMNNYEQKEFVWPNDPYRAKVFSDANAHVNIRQTNLNSSDFVVYNQNGLNY